MGVTHGQKALSIHAHRVFISLIHVQWGKPKGYPETMREQREGGPSAFMWTRTPRKHKYLADTDPGKEEKEQKAPAHKPATRVILHIPMVLITRKRMRQSAPAFLKPQPRDR